MASSSADPASSPSLVTLGLLPTDLEVDAGAFEPDPQTHSIAAFGIAFTVIGSAIGFVGIILNSTLFVSLLTTSITRDISRVTRSFMTCLALTDLVLLLVGLLYEIASSNAYTGFDTEFGCKISAYLPAASRVAWIGSLLIILIRSRILQVITPTGSIFLWMASLVIATPFVVHVGCLAVPRSAIEHMLNPDDPTASETVCICGFLSDNAGAVNIFGACLLIHLVLAVAVLLAICLRKKEPSQDEVDHYQKVTPRAQVSMALIFTGCIMSRYAYFMLSFFIDHAALATSHALGVSTIDLVTACLYYGSTLLHVILSPLARMLICRLCTKCCRHGISNNPDSATGASSIRQHSSINQSVLKRPSRIEAKSLNKRASRPDEVDSML